MFKKFKEGMAIGILFLFLSLLDQSGVFVKFIHENLTKIPFIVVLIGVLGGFTYALHQTKTGFVADVSKAWLDLIQQFFTLGFGAFGFIKLGVLLRIIFMSDPAKFHWKEEMLNFSALAIAAILIGAFWELKDEPIHPITKKIAMATAIMMIIFVLLLLRPGDGGEGYVDFLKAQIL